VEFAEVAATWLEEDKVVFGMSLRKADRRAVRRAKTAARRIETVRIEALRSAAWRELIEIDSGMALKADAGCVQRIIMDTTIPMAVLRVLQVMSLSQLAGP
jgi:hypothetical protein